MTYQEFYNEAYKIIEAGSDFSLAILFDKWWFSIPFSITTFCLFLLVTAAFTRKDALEHNLVLNLIYDDLDDIFDPDVPSLTSFVAIFGIITFIISLAMLIIFSITYDDVDTKALDKLYISYMEEQKDIKLKVHDVLWKEKDTEDLMSVEYDYDMTSYIFNNAICENCVKQYVYYKGDKDDEEYQKIKMLISFSLEDDEKPYIKTKPPLREDIDSYYKKDGLYNPILYLPKSEGGILK